MSKFCLKAANKILNIVIVVLLVVFGTYSVYALWDNSQIYLAAENIQAEMLKLKPKEDLTGKGPTFEELLRINSDICAWITIDNTHIDFPVLQGTTNSSYINTDVYGNFALAGSIFLDYRSDRNFKDTYSLIHGHHMAGGKMFGDLSLFHEKSFFDNNKTGKLLLPGKVYNLEIFAVMLVTASEDQIFKPKSYTAENISALYKFTEQRAMYYEPKVIGTLRGTRKPQILALATCSTGFTNARTVILAVMHPAVTEK